MERLHRELDEEEGCFSGKTLVEILGRERVLIEHHAGVSGYSRECICVRNAGGGVRITGSCLEIVRMTKEQLVICGRIMGVELCAGEA